MPAVAIRQRLTAPESQDLFKRWFDAAPIYSGPVVANRLGWQVARTVAKNAAIGVRRRGAPPAVARWADALRREGVIAIPDYLSPDRHELIRGAFDDYAGSPRVRNIGDENDSGIRYLTGPVVSDRPGDSGEAINAALADDPAIAALAESVIGRRVGLPHRLILQSLELGAGDVDDTDREQVLHADKAYPCVKAIYVMDRIDEGSSPFVYCPGTHRITAERLRYEHHMSVQESRRRQGREPEAGSGIELERSRAVMGPELRERLGVHERPMTCAGNTLIVVNNAGFHRRGSLEAGQRRRTLWVNFYPYQRPWYGRLAFRAAKSVIDTDNVSRALAAGNRGQLSGQ